MIADELTELVARAARGLGVDAPVVLEHPAEIVHGDYSTNIALLGGKLSGQPPLKLAEALVEAMRHALPTCVEDVEVAGPGFINFRLSMTFFQESVTRALSLDARWGHSGAYKGKRVMIEYTDPNPFKDFHIGHLMTNTIGEALARLYDASGAEVKRANYQGDVGLHVAMALWGMQQSDALGGELPDEAAPLGEKVAFMGAAYALGARAYREREEAKRAIEEINKKVYARTDNRINDLYDTGRRWSLSYFETIYEKLGTRFDHYFFESQTALIGARLVDEHPEIFEKSDGAVVFRGEPYGLHTRVFINAQGLPTYEAKELGLAVLKHETFPYDRSFVVSASEIRDYFKVLLKALELVRPDLAGKTVHVPHGVLRLPTGKMSSRTGEIVSFTGLLKDVTERVLERMEGGAEAGNRELAERIAIGALKYSILKQESGRDIVFDLDRAVSFEGDSGPYLAYTHARARSLLRKAKEARLEESAEAPPENVSDVERLLYRFPEVVERAQREHAPHHVSTYLIALAGAFNSWYGAERIIGPDASYKLALSRAVALTLKNGLWLLGIAAPERM